LAISDTSKLQAPDFGHGEADVLGPGWRARLWAWTPSAAGSYDVACHVRDGKHVGSTGWDDHKEAYGYITTLGMPAASLLLNPGIVLSKQTVKLNLQQPIDLTPLLASWGTESENSASIN